MTREHGRSGGGGGGDRKPTPLHSEGGEDVTRENGRGGGGTARLSVNRR